MIFEVLRLYLLLLGVFLYFFQVLYFQSFLDNPALTKDELLKAISENSALLERPIVVKGEKAKIGRPPESVLTIL